MKVIIARLFDSRTPARYIGRHRAPFVLPAAFVVGQARRARAARVVS
ncbi:hypothetical protein HDA40_004650 [Hamadaea flava]|uniref:Uncharacterized protein n=1 Tax=Hamadaea flava TaxID=1742688 RepID=A0ABV8LES2_9ACTN|nr:hypothetical protein [Hamadaea flava]MCP2326143.1 hypothetical protein [Hamadaea flava]